jgi:hypothetical protein
MRSSSRSPSISMKDLTPRTHAKAAEGANLVIKETSEGTRFSLKDDKDILVQNEKG